MACELLECCQFFKDNMEQLPKSAEYIREKICFGDYESCKRYQIYKHGGEETSSLDPDLDAVNKTTRCLLKRRRQLQ